MSWFDEVSYLLIMKSRYPDFTPNESGGYTYTNESGERVTIKPPDAS